MKIAVAGGTGLAGGHVVAELNAAGHDPVVLARSRGVDVVTGDGLTEALAGVEAVIDTTNLFTMSRKKATAFFGGASANLVRAGAVAGVRHHVVLSILGIDRVDTGYYAGKLAQEKVVQDSGIPWTIVRATQFHEFPGQLLGQVPGPLAFVPRMRSQPIAVAEVAQALARFAAGEPQGMVELAGPREEDMRALAKKWVKAQGARRAVLPLWLPGAGPRAMATGGLLPTAPGPRGTRTFDEWLEHNQGQV